MMKVTVCSTCRTVLLGHFATIAEATERIPHGDLDTCKCGAREWTEVEVDVALEFPSLRKAETIGISLINLA
jgi:hypothetical protein